MKRRRRPPKRFACIYCGRQTLAGWRACTWHRDLLRLDPYYSAAKAEAIHSWRAERDKA